MKINLTKYFAHFIRYSNTTKQRTYPNMYTVEKRACVLLKFYLEIVDCAIRMQTSTSIHLYQCNIHERGSDNDECSNYSITRRHTVSTNRLQTQSQLDQARHKLVISVEICVTFHYYTLNQSIILYFFFHLHQFSRIET